MNSPISRFSKNAKLFLGYVLLINMILGAVNVLHGLYILRIGFTEEFYGQVMAVKTIAVGAAAIPGAVFCCRYGPIRSLRMASVIIMISHILQFIFMDRTIILLGSLLSGIGLALIYVNEGPFIMRNSCEKNRVHLFSYNFTAIMLAYIIGNFFSGLMADLLAARYAAYISMRISLLFFTFVSFLSIIPVSLMTRPDSIPDKPNINIDITKLRHDGVKTMLSFSTLIGLGMGLTIPFFNIFLSYKLGIDSQRVGIIMSGSQFAIIAGAILIPLVAAKIGKVNSVIICQMLSIPFLILIATPPNEHLVIFAFLMRSSLMNMAYPLTQNLAMEQVDDTARPFFASLIKVFDHTFRGIGSFLGGYIMRNISYELPYYLTATLYFTATLVFVFYFSKGKKRRKFYVNSHFQT